MVHASTLGALEALLQFLREELVDLASMYLLVVPAMIALLPPLVSYLLVRIWLTIYNLCFFMFVKQLQARRDSSESHQHRSHPQEGCHAGEYHEREKDSRVRHHTGFRCIHRLGCPVLKYVCFGFELLHILFDFPGVFIDDGGRVERANFLRRDHLPSFRSIFCLHEW